MNAARTPQRTHSSTRVAQNVAAAVTAIGAYLGRVGLAVEHLGDAKRPRLVLVHGFTQTARSWSQIANDFSRDRLVVLVDAPGHGASASTRADLHDGAELLGQAGGEAVYVGYSMGGRLALHLAVARPNLVRALVLVGATAGIEDDEERDARREADARLADDIERDGVDAFLTRWLAQPLFASLPHDEAALDDRRRNTVEGLASSLRLAGTGSQQPLWGSLRSLAMPVLVVAGERDAKYVALGHRLAMEIGENARFAAVPDAGHAAHLEQPARFVALAREWLVEINR
jgi:2-succinyl-6-hydroxy-2,4-cyclohexadiene-1-carboxylate synthase